MCRPVSGSAMQEGQDWNRFLNEKTSTRKILRCAGPVEHEKHDVRNEVSRTMAKVSRCDKEDNV